MKKTLTFLSSARFRITLIIILGNFMLGFSYGAFLIPKQIVAGGTSGVAIIVEALSSFSPTLMVALLTWGFFFLGLVFFGKHFALKTLLATIIMPLGVAVAEHWSWLQSGVMEIQESWVIAVTAALLGGAGMGLTFRVGGSTGGFDILAYIIRKFFKIRITIVLFVVDMLIMLVGTLVIPLEQVLVGIAVSLFTNLVMDRVLFGGGETLQVQIISSKIEQILAIIHQDLERGSTLIKVVGGYSRTEQSMIQVVLDKRQFEALKLAVQDIDRRAFIMVVEAHTVIGEGFKEWRSDE